MLQKDLKVLIPYQSIVVKCLDTSKTRVRRDHLKLIGVIKASAFLHQYQRTILETAHGRYIIANEDDLKIALTYGEKSFTDSYYNLDDSDRAIIAVIKELEEKMGAIGVTSDDIVEKVRKDIGFQRTWTTDRLKRLRESSLIRGENVPSKGLSRLLYRTYDIDFESILKGSVNWRAIGEKSRKWREFLESHNSIVKFTRLS